jgi:hypothetical protein
MKDRAMMGPALHEREPDDLYETPTWVTQVLLNWINFQRVWEPACGRGMIAKELARVGIDVAATDLREYGYGASGIDFLTCTDETSRDIVTNPPYSKSDAFVRKALKLTEKHQGVVAMLMRAEWDSALARDEFLMPGSRYMAKIVLTRRVRWFEGSTGQPRHNHAWFVWGGKPVDDAILLRGR